MAVSRGAGARLMCGSVRWRLEADLGESSVGGVLGGRWVRVRTLESEPFDGVVCVDDAVPANNSSRLIGAELDNVTAGEASWDIPPATDDTVPFPDHSSPTAARGVIWPECPEPCHCACGQR
jgi:hypothetical protein